MIPPALYLISPLLLDFTKGLHAARADVAHHGGDGSACRRSKNGVSWRGEQTGEELRKGNDVDAAAQRWLPAAENRRW